MNAYSYTDYISKIGILPLSSLQDEDYYKRYENFPDAKPRKIFKISKYKNSDENLVWLAYVSGANPDPDFEDAYLDHVFIIMLINDKLKIVKEYIYSDYPDAVFTWKSQGGLDGIRLEQLENPIEIERYIEPCDKFDGLENYRDNI
ncbi:MAG: hypothetical protein N4A49_09625 [Marinifilaceae bacterium]|jgi:hypothetical protein|nr:hypothetical protein [Marinifilaceae bacterium]